MTERVLYLVAFFAGVALAVHSMLHGMGHWKRRSGKQSPAVNPPTVAAMLIGLGVTGYLIATRANLGVVATLALSAATGAASFTGMTFLMAKWALRGSEPTALSAEEVNGQVATVSRTITPDEPGEIAYFAWDENHVLPARSIDGSTIAEGTEVVIDTVENGVARVELWSVVEQRL